jgi:hypothetical protein
MKNNPEIAVSRGGSIEMNKDYPALKSLSREKCANAQIANVES